MAHFLNHPKRLRREKQTISKRALFYLYPGLFETQAIIDYAIGNCPHFPSGSSGLVKKFPDNRKIFLPFSLIAIDQLCAYSKLLKDLVVPISTKIA